MEKAELLIEEEFVYTEDEPSHVTQLWSVKVVETGGVCSICGIMLSTKEHLRLHEETHKSVPDEEERSNEGKAISQVVVTANGEFECARCGKRFATKNETKEHYYQMHCGKSRQQCGKCAFSCYSKSSLDVHTMKCHTKRYTCEVCGRMFAYKYMLRTHINGVHLNIRDHTCDICGKGFKTRANFDTHMARHTDVRNFGCSYCPHKSRTNHDLSIHVRRHTGERPFTCAICGKAFAHSINKLKHERTMHGKSSATGLIIRFPDNEVVEES